MLSKQADAGYQYKSNYWIFAQESYDFYRFREIQQGTGVV